MQSLPNMSRHQQVLLPLLFCRRGSNTGLRKNRGRVKRGPKILVYIYIYIYIWPANGRIWGPLMPPLESFWAIAEGKDSFCMPGLQT